MLYTCQLRENLEWLTLARDNVAWAGEDSFDMWFRTLIHCVFTKGKNQQRNFILVLGFDMILRNFLWLLVRNLIGKMADIWGKQKPRDLWFQKTIQNVGS
jgi:hypothetical protein